MFIYIYLKYFNFYIFLKYFYFLYIYIYLSIFIYLAAPNLSFYYLTMLCLSCRMQDLVTWPGIEPSSLHWEWGVLATGPPGKSLFVYILKLLCFIFKKCNCIGVYGFIVVLVLGVQQMDSVMHICIYICPFFFRFFFI